MTPERLREIKKMDRGPFLPTVKELIEALEEANEQIETLRRALRIFYDLDYTIYTEEPETYRGLA